MPSQSTNKFIFDDFWSLDHIAHVLLEAHIELHGDAFGEVRDHVSEELLGIWRIENIRDDSLNDSFVICVLEVVGDLQDAAFLENLQCCE